MTRDRVREASPCRPEAQAAYLDAQVGQLRAAIERARAADGQPALGQAAGTRAASAEERIKAKLDTDQRPRRSPSNRPASTTCSSTRPTATRTCAPSSNISDVAIDGSNRATTCT